jgi:four helix bundle protein
MKRGGRRKGLKDLEGRKEKGGASGMQREMNAKANTFEDLLAWQQARKLTRAVYQVTASGRLSTDRALCAQLRRASSSIMANVAEGFERGRRTECHQFLSIAKGSCAEVRTFLYVALDAGVLDRAAFDQLLGLASSTSRTIARLRSAVAKQRAARRKSAPFPLFLPPLQVPSPLVPSSLYLRMSSIQITRCVCQRMPFATLLPLAREQGWTLDEIMRETGCGDQCGLCRPYLREMLRTGQTEFHQVLWE